MTHITVTPPVYDKQDLEGTIKRLCDYNVMLNEQLQYCLTLMEKQINGVIDRMNKLGEKMKQLEEKVGSAVTRMDAMGESVARLYSRVGELEQKINK